MDNNNIYNSDEEYLTDGSDEESTMIKYNTKYINNNLYAPIEKKNNNNSYALKKLPCSKNIINEHKIAPKILFPDDKKTNEDEVDKFIGLYEDDIKFKKYLKTDWRHCDYCEKKHGKEYFLKNISYCILCWSWLNVNDLDLETGEYVGEHNFDDIKAILLKTYQMYNNIKDKNPSSIYTKINSYNEAGILHTTLKKLLGFEQEKKIKQEYLIYNKSRKLNINYEKSILEI